MNEQMIKDFCKMQLSINEAQNVINVRQVEINDGFIEEFAGLKTIMQTQSENMLKLVDIIKDLESRIEYLENRI